MNGSLKATVLSDLTFEINEERVKDELSSIDDEFEDKFNPDIPPSQAQSIVDEIDIKYEDADYHNNNGNSDYESDVQMSHPKFESESVSGPDYSPPTSPHLTQNVGRQGLTKNNGSSDSKSYKTNKWNPSSQQLFKCDVCHKSLSTKSNLKDHMRIHSGQRHYKCRECEKSFVKLDGLTRHMLVHTGEKPYHYTECEKSFSQPSHLTRHMRTHTGEKPFKCDECEKSFSQPTHLTTHTRIHTGEKPFTCDECEKVFTNSWGLNAHKRTHTGERPFKCTVCDQSFASSSHLCLHRKRKH